MRKLDSYTRQCKYCKDWFNTSSRCGEVCQECKDNHKKGLEPKICVECGKKFYRNTKVRKGRGLHGVRPKNSVCCCPKCSRTNVKTKRKNG